MYRYGSTGVKVGNRGVTTAMAVAALSSPDIAVQENSTSKLSSMNEVVKMIDVK